MSTAAILGGGVIGGGWAARFLLAGWDVRVFDPDRQAERKLNEVLANARRAAPGLSDAPLPPEGRLSWHETIADAVTGADWIQESVPEQLALKHKVLAEVQAACDAGAIIGSSTSGFRPSQLQEQSVDAGQIVVTHPFNPVYLIPLVELVPSDKCSVDRVESAKKILTEIGMVPLHVRREIDAHIGDRLLEAVWREALWLVHDGVATTEEIDEVIRLSFGLRWAQMGLFETYRIAGGEAGMRHFMAQFGPALAWPWTKLMDVPEFTPALVDQIAAQSDAQSGYMSIRELERCRDDNLVAILRALKARDQAAGRHLNARDAVLAGDLDAPAEELDPAQPVLTLSQAVPLDWVDYNGHMNEARYLEAFSRATDRFMAKIGCDAEYIARGLSYFTVETHLRHLDEATAGTPITVHTRVLNASAKKMHLWSEMHAGTRLLATAEQFLLHVSLETRSAVDAEPQVERALARLADGHANLPKPEGAGRHVGQRA